MEWVFNIICYNRITFRAHLCRVVTMKVMDLSKHISIKLSDKIAEIFQPLKDSYGIAHFRYIRIYKKDGARITLSTYPDLIRYVYEEGNYEHMWFDGVLQGYFKPGWHFRRLNVRIDERVEGTKIDRALKEDLGLTEGMAFIEDSNEFWEIYSFDSNDVGLYYVDFSILMRFILFFKQEARKIIQLGEREKIIVPVKPKLVANKLSSEQAQKLKEYFSRTRIKRFYLSGAYRDIYLTSKEVAYVYLLAQGKSAEDIALEEGANIRTVESHIERVRLKLGCKKQTQIVKIILDAGIVEMDGQDM